MSWVVGCRKKLYRYLILDLFKLLNGGQDVSKFLILTVRFSLVYQTGDPDTAKHVHWQQTDRFGEKW